MYTFSLINLGVSEEDDPLVRAGVKPPKPKKLKKQPREDVKIRKALIKAKQLAFDNLPKEKNTVNLV